jgi:hypothetical protein
MNSYNALHIRGLSLILTFFSFSCIGTQPPPKKIKIERLPLPAIPNPIPPKKRNVMLSLRTLCGFAVTAPSFPTKYRPFLARLPKDLQDYLKWLRSVQQYPQHEFGKLFTEQIRGTQIGSSLTIDPELIKTAYVCGADLNAHCGEKDYRNTRLMVRNYGDTGLPLNLATRSNNFSLVEILVRLGATVNIRDIFGNLPLTIAAKYASEEITRFLLDNGSNANAKNTRMQTALLVALANNRKEIIPLLLSRTQNINNCSPEESPLYAAIDRDDPELLQLVFQNGIIYPPPQNTLRSPLTKAVVNLK